MDILSLTSHKIATTWASPEATFCWACTAWCLRVQHWILIHHSLPASNTQRFQPVLKFPRISLLISFFYGKRGMRYEGGGRSKLPWETTEEDQRSTSCKHWLLMKEMQQRRFFALKEKHEKRHWLARTTLSGSTPGWQLNTEEDSG